MSLSNYIMESKSFCDHAGMNPKEIPFPKVVMTPKELEDKRQDYEEILSVVQFFGNKILDSMKGTPILLSVADARGFILHMMGDETIKNMINQLGIRTGIQFSEEVMGTNVVTLSLKHSGYAIQLIGPDHYHEYLHQTACYAVAFHYTDANNLLGSLIIMTALEYQNPLMVTMLSTTVDSIERELMLRKQNRKLDIMNQILMDNTRNGIIITDKEGEITDFNHFAQDLTGLSKEQTLGRSVLCLEPMGQYIYDVIRHGKKYEDIQISFERKGSGTRTVCLFDAFPIYDEYKRLIGAFGQFRNITDRYEAEEKYNYLANHDDLTKLPNRRYYKQVLVPLLERAKRGLHPSGIAIMYLDLDRFKLVNDTLGHSNGDLLLKQIAERLTCSLEATDLVARMGGDEFMFLFPIVTDEQQVVHRAERILSLFQHPFNMNGYEFHITASIGIAFYPDDGLDIEMLMIHADTAMYRAKQRGKNQYVIYSDDMQTKSHEKIKMETSLRRAIDNNEFVLYYQPQIDIKTGDIKGAEALIRWMHPERGLVSPYEFIPLAEETGLIIQMDQWVLRTACMQNKSWQEKGLPPMRVAVNLSSQQFSKEYLAETVKSILEETGLEPKFLELEITETMTMDVEHTIPTLRQLHGLGVQISIDDFGTGYSSLNYLKKFSIDRLKIDQSFVRDIMTNSHDSDIVGTIIAMAHNLGLEVIAEGVEEKDQLRFLQYQKCNEVQGYYFSEPIPAEKFELHFQELQEKVKRKY
ncbi:putative bifunctional diguanylate cyclase/phosphodiesterase [Paenibacillus oleatilyticus]|uniref:putative bifunctional diguanylate cyclase/phosphodiesterase n=1 Tax=Paenibacillus oleatilyticus TaxID=2594886 RepID=UPI001C1FE480|nr:EAL domain-containing protein [Paenibacillus oleatilyticus]MBU7319364.1 EAL domain-containing protein [Paenibacillus oleatilyticus]